MSKFMKIGGKDGNDIARGISVNVKGELKTVIADKEKKVTSLNNVTAAPGVNIALGVINAADPYTIAKVALRVSANGTYKLYAQHKNGSDADVGTSESQDKPGQSLYLKAQRRSTKMELYFRNLGTSDVTFSADVTLSVDSEDASFLLAGNNGDFRQRGDADSGAGYARLFNNATTPVSSSSPLPVSNSAPEIKNATFSKIRGATVQPGAAVGLIGLEENSPFNTVRVVVNQGVVNNCRLYAQHTDEINTDYGTTEVDERGSRIVSLRATKRTTKMSVLFRNLGTSPVTINADVVLTTEMSSDDNIMNGHGEDFRQKGDAKSGAAYSRLYVTDTLPASTSNPLPVGLQVDKTGATGKLSLSAVEDSAGKGVLRVVDASPHAYDSQSDALKVRSVNENWSLTGKFTGEDYTLTKDSIITKYHSVKSIIISAQDDTCVLEWSLLSGNNTIAQGYVTGSQVIKTDFKIGDVEDALLIVSKVNPSDTSSVAVNLIGETLEVS